mmetsp:Transcript_10378/g.17187  ORF Transcript_10378/g.17187 Transcript_10378/m.17187 type:complete len:123 (-) Transcript_10378:265-633(-)
MRTDAAVSSKIQEIMHPHHHHPPISVSIVQTPEKMTMHHPLQAVQVSRYILKNKQEKERIVWYRLEAVAAAYSTLGATVDLSTIFDKISIRDFLLLSLSARALTQRPFESSGCSTASLSSSR